MWQKGFCWYNKGKGLEMGRFPQIILVGLKVKSESCSVVSDSLRPHGLCRPWNSPGQNTRVGNLSLVQGIFQTPGSNPGLLHCRRILYQLSYLVDLVLQMSQSICPRPLARVWVVCWPSLWPGLIAPSLQSLPPYSLDFCVQTSFFIRTLATSD